MDAGMAPAGGAGGAGGSEAAKEEVDGRSVYIGNVDYGCTPEELQVLLFMKIDRINCSNNNRKTKNRFFRFLHMFFSCRRTSRSVGQ
jgi:hypothetical protein